MTDEHKPESAPDNLFEPISGHDTTANGFRAMKRSAYNRLQSHPLLRKAALAGAVLGTATLIARRAGR